MFETDGLIPTVQKMFSEGLAPKDAAVELDEALGNVWNKILRFMMRFRMECRRIVLKRGKPLFKGRD